MKETQFEDLVSWGVVNRLALFPIPAGCKLPTGIVGSHATDWSHDPEQWRQWRLENPGCNFGVECGPSGLIVVDIDVLDGVTQTDVFDNWWRDHVGGLPPPPTVRSPTGGAHVYFRVPEAVDPRSLGQPDLGKKINVRAGNGYVVSAYSVTRFGADDGVKADGRYELVGPITEAPQALLDHCRPREKRSAIVRQDIDLACDGYPVETLRREFVQARVNSALTDLRKATKGHRNDTLFRAAFACGKLVAGGLLERATAEQLLTEAALSVGLGSDEIEKTISSGFKSAKDKGQDDFEDPAVVFANVHTVAGPLSASTVTASPPRRLKSVGDFCAEYEPLTYVMEPMVRSSAIYTLTAATGTGKTAFLVATSLAIASGRRELLNVDITAGRVAYCTFENPEDVRQRFIITASRYEISLSGLGDRLSVIALRCSPEEVLATLIQAGPPGGFVLIIVDTLQAAFDGKDSNHNVEAGDFIRRLRRLTTELPGHPAVIIAAHPTKGAGENLIPYGAGAILNELDGNLTLSKDGEIVQLHWHGKLRGREFAKVPFRFEQHACSGLLDNKGRPIEIPVLRPVTAADINFGPPLDTIKMRVLRALVEEPDGTQRRWAKMAGCEHSTVSEHLKNWLTRSGFVEHIGRRWVVTATGCRMVSDSTISDDQSKPDMEALK